VRETKTKAEQYNGSGGWPWRDIFIACVKKKRKESLQQRAIIS
jgi:hypothetical protein